MSAYDELVGRLEGTRPVYNGLGQPIPNMVDLRNPDGPEAAAAIRTLEGERDASEAEALNANQECARLMIANAASEAARQSAEAKLEAVRKLIEEAHFECKQGCGGAARWTLEEALASLDKEKAGG